ncbi:hypothetical protein [Acidimangrovimonas pyrenivorans]|uniref:HTH DNA binding domain-containing protein n=1 Tax=Acidimangrovimonas pyrenivorans TaxID=2030798 RepID=A0ABV7AMG2_9RHOB
MTSSPTDSEQDFNDGLSLPSPYDTAPADEPWFLPPPPEGEAWQMPGPRVERPVAVDVADWAAAEAGAGLVRAAVALARLDERLRCSPGATGLIRRLALEEAEALVRASGDRLPAGALALAVAQRGSGTEEDTRRLRAAAWAERRLLAALATAPGGLGAFLGLQTVSNPALGELAPRPGGIELALAAEAWEAGLSALDAHPLTRAGFAHHLWRGLGLSLPEDMVESGTTAALIGAEEARVLPFVPVALAGGGAHRAGGPAAERLRAWYGGVERGCLAALLSCERVSAWRARAAARTADLQGRTVPRLLDALAAAPLVSAAAAAVEAGCSRSAAERNLALLRDRGLVAELTGQSRFRLWRTRI